MMNKVRTCRFCKETAHEDWLVKYGTRHYAHPSCFLARGHMTAELNNWEQRQFARKLADWNELQQSKQATGGSL